MSVLLGKAAFNQVCRLLTALGSATLSSNALGVGSKGVLFLGKSLLDPRSLLHPTPGFWGA